MAGRLWTAVLMLAAVLAVHGLQCATAPAGAGSAGPAAHLAVVAALGPAAATALTPGHLPVAGDDGARGDAPTGHAGDALPDHAGAAAAPGGTGHGGGSHDWAAHLWTTCLAVLAAALAVLLARFLPRPVRSAAPALRRGRARVPAWSTPPRPPDLAALCLLRI